MMIRRGGPQPNGTVMRTDVDISLLVSMAAILTLIALMLVLYLLRSTSEQFRKATYWYAASTLCLVVAVAGVLTTQVAPYAATAIMIIWGAHFGILFAYAAFRQTAGKPLLWAVVVPLSALACLVQAGLAFRGDSVGLLMATSSLVNGPFALLAGIDLMWRFRAQRRAYAFLLGLPFLMIALAYLARLGLLFTPQDAALVILSTASIAFVLGVASMYWGFALIIQREAELNLQLKDAREQAEKMSRQQARFFAQMNHELRTPLNGVLGLAELLRPHLQQGEGATLLQELHRSGELLLSIVNEVLDFSKAEAGQVQLEKLPMDLEEVLKNAALQYRRLAASKSVQLDLHVHPPDMPPVLGDPTRINQIFQNLFSNALKFTRAGQITVTVTRGLDDLVNVIVQDTGIGMTKEQLDVLFVPFQQASADTTRRFGGTGLGMSIVQMLVHAMQGQIHVDSEAGRGTKITVTLPLPVADMSGPDPERHGHGPQADWCEACCALAILCADDDPINRLVLQALLESYGVRPVMAQDGHEAVRLAAKGPFDAYVIDISMPGMDGVETLATLREGDRRKGYGAPMAIAATANVMTEDVNAYLAAGFDAHLPKPIRREELEGVLRAILSRISQTV